MKREHYKLALAARKLMNKALDGGLVRHVNGEGEEPSNLTRSRKATACTVIVTKKHVHICSNQACHAGLSNNYDGFPEDKGTRIAVISPVQESKEPKEYLLRFIDWYINRSPYAKLGVFVNKSAKDVLKYGFICNTDVPANIMAGALIGSRIMWEYTSILESWIAQVDAGIDESAAFYIAHILCVNGSNFSVLRNAGHCAIDGNTGCVNNLMRFVNAKPSYVRENYIDHYNYAGVHDSWSDDKPSEELLALFREAGAVKKKFNSLFSRAAEIQNGSDDAAIYTAEQIKQVVDKLLAKGAKIK